MTAAKPLDLVADVGALQSEKGEDGLTPPRWNHLLPFSNDYTLAMGGGSYFIMPLLPERQGILPIGVHCDAHARPYSGLWQEDPHDPRADGR